MMVRPVRFLLISDTHGSLGVINELVSRTHADAVIHAGDFGLYDDGSFERLSERELRLQIVHSDLPSDEKARILALPMEGKIQSAREHCLLGDFQSYFDGRLRFHVPVYAVWGNHEDKAVVERLVRGDHAVDNLHLLHQNQAFHLGQAFVYGLGGNLLPGAKMLQQPFSGGSGKVWSTLSQYADWVGMVDEEAGQEAFRIQVTHVSPGKEPFMEYLGARTQSNFTVSGHMGAPTTMTWNAFAVHSVEEARERLRQGLASVKTACVKSTRGNSQWVEQQIARIEKTPDETDFLGHGQKEPPWYRGMTHINLPDAHMGYAVMDIGDGGVKLQTFLR